MYLTTLLSVAAFVIGEVMTACGAKSVGLISSAGRRGKADVGACGRPVA